MKKDISKLFPFLELSISQDFHDKTKIKEFLEKKSTVPTPGEWTTINYKGYPRFNKIKLTKPKKFSNLSLIRCLIKRQSCRDFSSEGISKMQLSILLKYSAGLKKKKAKDSGNRFYPSAGARYPLEVYPIILNGKELKKGVYHYHIKSHSLEYMWTPEDFETKVISCFNQKWIKDVDLILVVTAVFWRTQVKYSERGYRHILLESGGISQNISLISEALGLGSCIIGGFIDDKIHKLLDIDGQEEAVVTVITIGNKKE